jgi:hypothetical protein
MIIRSAFWLCVGFVLVAPHGTDFGAAATQVRDQAIVAGSQAVTQIVVDQALGSEAAKVVTASLVSPRSVLRSVPRSSIPAFVFPRPRPAAMG